MTKRLLAFILGAIFAFSIAAACPCLASSESHPPFPTNYGFIDIWSEGQDTCIRNNMKIAIDITYEVEAGASPADIVIDAGGTAVLRGVSESQLQIIAIESAPSNGDPQPPLELPNAVIYI